MPHRLIGRTAVFGTVSQGSSPCGATKQKSHAVMRGFFYFNTLPSLLRRKSWNKKCACEAWAGVLFALGRDAKAEGPPKGQSWLFFPTYWAHEIIKETCEARTSLLFALSRNAFFSRTCRAKQIPFSPKHSETIMH